MAYATPTQQLLNIAGGKGDAVETALNAASYDINAAFSRAGYSTPLAVAEIGTELEAKLREVCQALAAWSLSSGFRGRRGMPDKIAKDGDRAREWLKGVSEGVERFSTLTVASEQAGGLSVIGDHAWPDLRNAFDVAGRLFD